MADKHDTHLNSPSRVRAKMKPHAQEVAQEVAMPIVDAAVSKDAQDGPHAPVQHNGADVREDVIQESQSSPSNSPTSITRIEPQAPLTRRQGQHLTDDERAAVKATFLDEFARRANVTAACEIAGIDRSMVYDWLRDDAQFAEGWQAAERKADDALRREAWRRGVEGTDEVVVSMGKLVYEYEPVLDAMGQQRYDSEGKPVMRPVKPLYVKKYSDALLTTLMRARMPEFREKSQVDVNASGSINVAAVSAHQLTIDVRNMNADELAEVRRIAQAMKDREEGRHDNG